MTVLPSRKNALDTCTNRDAMLNGPVTSEEVMLALRKAKNWKALGSNGIPSEFLKLCLPSKKEIKDKAAYSPMFLCLHKTIDSIFSKSQALPKHWTTSLIVPIFKKGDPNDPNNYRGISLMDTSLKLLLFKKD